MSATSPLAYGLHEYPVPAGELPPLPDDPYVLVVEDDNDLRAMTLDMLGAEGYPAVGVPDGVIALHLAVRCCPALILLDAQTPTMSGAEFARLYHALPGPQAPLVLVSGISELEQLGTALGAVATLSKPFDMDTLLDTVRHLGRFTPGLTS